MLNIPFENDHFSRKVMHYFLLLQAGALVMVFILIALHFYSLALGISCMTFFVFIGVFSWLYLRYQRMPVVREKRDLQQQALRLQNGIHSEEDVIRAAKKRRESLPPAEQNEIRTTLLILQEDYVPRGLASAYIKDSVIPGVGPKLKQRLAEHRIVSAIQVNDGISQVPGLRESKRAALVSWRSSIQAELASAMPSNLSRVQIERIRQKYLALQNEDAVNERRAKDNRKKLEDDLHSLRPRLKQLASISFVAYLGKFLASRGYVAILLAFSLIITQTVSGISATRSAIMASLPTATLTPSATLTPTNTFTPTATFTPTISETPTITYTPTITFTATITSTPSKTSTPTKTRTPIPSRTLVVIITSIPQNNIPQGVTAICEDGSYSYSEHRQGTCSHHGGVKQWINRPPN